MERCPHCKNRGGLEYGCLEDGCDVYLFSDNVKEEECGGQCWYCVDCDNVNLQHEEMVTDAFGDLENAFDGALSVSDILNYDAD